VAHDAGYLELADFLEKGMVLDTRADIESMGFGTEFNSGELFRNAGPAPYTKDVTSFKRDELVNWIDTSIRATAASLSISDEVCYAF
jgi:hypothetical protein